MGTWGTGNFDNDAALDYVEELADSLEARIEECFADEESCALDEDGEGVLMPSVALLLMLQEQVKVTPPKPETVARWRKRYLAVFDGQIDDLEPAENYAEERRKVIEETFEALEHHAQEFANIEASVEHLRPAETDEGDRTGS